MMHPRDRISAYADGELGAVEAAALEAHLETCSECARELALIRSMGEAMTMNAQARGSTGSGSLWPTVHRRITQPAAWLLLVAGFVVWLAIGVLEWFRSGELTLRWLATTAIVIGLALLLVAIGYEQYREWRSSPYKDIER